MLNPWSLISGCLPQQVRTARGRRAPDGEAVFAEKSVPRASKVNGMFDGLAKLRGSLSNFTLENPIASLSKRTLKRRDDILRALMFTCSIDPSNAQRANSLSSHLNDLCEKAEDDIRECARYRSVESTWRYFRDEIMAMRAVLTRPGEAAYCRVQQMIDTLDAEMSKFRSQPSGGKRSRLSSDKRVDGRDGDACRGFQMLLDMFDSGRIKPLKLKGGKVSGDDVKLWDEKRFNTACIWLRMKDKAQLADMLATRERKGMLGAWGTALQRALDEVRFQLPPIAERARVVRTGGAGWGDATTSRPSPRWR